MGQNRQTHVQTHEDNCAVQEIEGLWGNFPGMTKLVKLPPHILLSWTTALYVLHAWYPSNRHCNAYAGKHSTWQKRKCLDKLRYQPFLLRENKESKRFLAAEKSWQTDWGWSMNHQSEVSIKKRVCDMRPGRQEGNTQLVCAGKTTHYQQQVGLVLTWIEQSQSWWLCAAKWLLVKK